MQQLINKIKQWSGWLLLAWFIVVLALALIPLSSTVTILDIGKIEIRFDYLYHIITFAIATLLAVLYSQKPFPSPESPALHPERRSRLVSFISLILLFSIAHEYLQKLIPYRSFNINDIISNLLGVILGIIIAILLRRHLR